jgi:hypothetical protein
LVHAEPSPHHERLSSGAGSLVEADERMSLESERFSKEAVSQGVTGFAT